MKKFYLTHLLFHPRPSLLQVIVHLKIQPVFGGLAKRLTEQKRNLCRYRTSAVDNMGNAHLRDTQRPREISLGDFQPPQNLLQELTRMNSRQTIVLRHNL